MKWPILTKTVGCTWRRWRRYWKENQSWWW
uniref:Uncharacterized protein n=1 Tax=Rhizophora mucronata TaxID=61149 RepID=A0A2P2K463_RHIMU